MFELGIGEMLVIAIVIVVLFGPDKLPSIARDLGQGVRKMKGAGGYSCFGNKKRD